MSKKNILQAETEVLVRFNEADPLGIVWHGHYIRYFEDGREDFGKRYGIGYLDFYENGFVIPIVNVDCSFKKSLRYGDTVLVETLLFRVTLQRLNSVIVCLTRIQKSW
jgi:acyl-CoA thioester hydrolase